MTSQLVIFRVFFSRPHNPKSEKKNSHKSTNKKILAKRTVPTVYGSTVMMDFFHDLLLSAEFFFQIQLFQKINTGMI